MRRPCYQCDEDLEAITDARNEVIRAWGRQQLADADAHILIESVRDGGDWDLIEDEAEEIRTVGPAIPVEETEEEIVPPAPIEPASTPVVEAPKPPKTPKPAKPATS